MDLILFVLPMVCLLGFSACMSGCETAWFSLSVAEGDRLRTTEGWAARPVRHLLARPEQLLMTLLLGNLLVNLLFLSLAAELALDLERRGRGSAAVAVGTGALIVLIFFGELLPKILARPRAALLAWALAWPLWFIERALALPVFLLSRTIRSLSHFLVGPPLQMKERRIDLLKLVDLSHSKGVIAEEQRRVLHEVLGFSRLRVRDVMIPRVDVASIDLRGTREQALAEIKARSVSRLLAVDGDLDRVAGQIQAHEVMLQPDMPLRRLVRAVPAVPEIGTARRALAQLERTGSTIAVAVDEYGGTAGIVTFNDLVAQVVGEIADEHAVPARRVMAKGTDRFLVAGWTSLVEWRTRAGVEEHDELATTVGGLMLRRLDRAPKVGDIVKTDAFEYNVRRVRGGRVVLIEARRITPPVAAAAGEAAP